MVPIDCETVGLVGPIVLLQYSESMEIGDKIHLYDVWREKTRTTLNLIEKLMDSEICAFNLTFDHFHLCQMYNVLRLMPPDEVPDYLQFAELEPEGIKQALCLKPKAALDLFLVAKRGPYQSLMERDDVKIKRVPKQLAHKLAIELGNRVKLRGIYFGRRKDRYKPQWSVEETDDADFMNVTLRFAATSALKALIADIFPNDDIVKMRDFTQNLPVVTELGYAPFALANGKPPDWGGAWPVHIKEHILLWSYNELARKYGTNDIIYLQKLYKHFNNPPAGDYNSELCINVANCRYKGFSIDIPKIKELKQKVIGKIIGIPTAPNVVMIWLEQNMSDVEKSVFLNTKALTLEEIASWTEECPICSGHLVPDCIACVGTGKVLHKAAIKAQQVLDARSAIKEIELFDKLLLAGRFHASFKVIGTLSDRMSGADGLNPQGIKKTDEVRSCFPLAEAELQLCGGDFSGFEVVLADAVYADPKLRKDLTDILPCNICKTTGKINGKPCKACEGKGKGPKKIHALFGQNVFTDMSYDEILATQGTEDDAYSKSKQAVFAMLYGGTGFTLKDRLGVDIEVAEAAYERFIKMYPGVGEARSKVFKQFCSMQQPGGIGTSVEWHDPSDFIESIYGFRRYYTLENQICKALFDLASDVPESWKTLKMKVRRRDREQTIFGATQSALYGAAFMIQAQSMRSACNHVIQSSGANLTKNLQLEIWNIQPQGIHPFEIMVLNAHDELMCPTKHKDKVREIVDNFIIKHKGKVPLLKIDWKDSMSTWADKH